MNKNRLENKNNNIKSRLGGLSTTRLVSIILTTGLLAAAFGFALFGCDDVAGLNEDVANAPPGLPVGQSTDLTLSPFVQDVWNYTMGSEDFPKFTVYATLSGGASGLVKFTWYKAGIPPAADEQIDEDTALPGTGVDYQLQPADVAEAGQTTYYVVASYPAKGTPVLQTVSTPVTVNVYNQGTDFGADYDGDGYPDDWERDHRSEGYNPYKVNTPYGIDLSLKGAVPPGVKFDYKNRVAYDPGNRFVVYGVPATGIMEYRVYNSSGKDSEVIVDVINLSADKDSHAGEADYELHTTAIVYVSADVGDYNNYTNPYDGKNHPLTLRTGASGTVSGGNIVIESGADVKIHADKVNLVGGAPISLQPGATLTLELYDHNELTAGVVNRQTTNGSFTGKLDIACAGIQVPEGAALIIEAARTDQADTLTVAGGYGTGNADQWTTKTGTWGCAAAIRSPASAIRSPPTTTRSW